MEVLTLKDLIPLSPVLSKHTEQLSTSLDKYYTAKKHEDKFKLGK